MAGYGGLGDAGVGMNEQGVHLANADKQSLFRIAGFLKGAEV